MIAIDTQKIGIFALVLSICAFGMISDINIDTSLFQTKQNATNMSVLKVNKTGDTMTGGLVISGVQNAITMNKAGYAVISSNNSMYFRPANGLTYFNGVGQTNRFFAYDYIHDAGGCTYLDMRGTSMSFQIGCGSVMSFSTIGNSFINTTYNMSIGKYQSTARLDVNGTLRANGTVRFDTLNASGTRAVCVTAGILSPSTNVSSSYLTC